MSDLDSRKGSNESAQVPSSTSQPSERATPTSVEPTPQPDSTRRSSTLLSLGTPAPAFRLSKTPNDPSAGKAPKVAIPRLPQRGDPAAAGGTRSGGRHRVMHACEPCRLRKTKCSGEKPACKHCQDFKVACVYADGKRDRAKKAFGSLAEKVADYEALLKDLTGRVGEEDAQLITTLLEKDVVSSYGDQSETADTLPEVDGVSEDSGEESDVSAGVGSTGAVDRIEEDFNRSEDARTTGFMGKNSEITWMQKLRQENKFGPETGSGPDPEADFRRKTGGASPLFSRRSPGSPNRKTMPDAFEGLSVNESSYHLDDFCISIPEAVDPFGMPPRAVADHLFHAYLDSVHHSFPIIGKITFSSQYRKLMEAPSSRPGERWLAILNMIFAIGATYSHLVEADWRGDERDHLIYFSRARLLSMNGNTIFNHPDLQQVQVSGLIAFYLFATGQINRAWTIGGTAVRAAISLGINMRNDSGRTPDTSKEIRYRVWWSLYTLEHQLSMTTGRPTSVPDHACTAPLPVPIDEDAFQSQAAMTMLGADMQKNARYPGWLYRSPNNRSPATSSSDRSDSASKSTSASRSSSMPQKLDFDWARNVAPSCSLYFLHHVKLTKIAQASLDRIYTPVATQTNWSTVQSVMSELEEMIQDWHNDLPGALDFKRKQRDQNFVQQRMCLGFSYYGARIIVNRPCLCRLDRKIPAQSIKSREFNRAAAATCVDSARDMLQMLPDEPNAVGLNRICPWWCIVHYLMQATIVLLLELSFRAHHMPERAEGVFDGAKKAVRWLHNLGEESYSARRAWALCNSMLRESAPRIGREVHQLPEQPPGPLNPPSYSQAGGSIARYSPATSGPALMQATPQSGDNFTVAQQDLANLTMFSGYDEYASYSSGEAPMSFFPTSAEMEFMNDAYLEPLQSHEYGEQQYVDE